MRETDEKKNLVTYRCESDSWSDDEDSSSTSSDTSSGSDFFQMVVESSSAPKHIPEIKTHGELGLDDLPPIEDLTISIPQEDMMLIGHVHAVVDKLVVVHAIKDMKPLDIDSVLFLTNDKPLGRVYDVFGPVVEPYYCIRFNSIDDINQKIIEIGADVFFAPQKNEITSYVFVDELQRQKGSDASWKFNNEPPEECLDFSDDEQEKAAKRKRMAEIRNRRFSSSSDLAAKRPALMNGSDSQQNLHNNCKSPINRNIINIPIQPIHTNATVNPFNRVRLPCPPSPSPSISAVFQTPMSAPFSNSYPSHHSSSPLPSVSSTLISPKFTPFPNLYAPFPSPSIASLSCPPSPTPSVCSLVSVSVRARTQSGNFSTPKQPRLPFFQRLPPNTPQRAFMLPSNLQPSILRTPSPYQPPSSALLQVQQQPHLQGPLSSKSAIQQPAVPPETINQGSTITLRNEIERPALQFKHILQRPAFPPVLPPYQQTHLFGQVTIMSPLLTLPPPLLPPPPINITRCVPPPVIPTNYFSPVNPGCPPPYPSPNASSRVPPHHPLTIEIPNINSPPIPLNQHQIGASENNTVLPVINNGIKNRQSPLY